LKTAGLSVMPAVVAIIISTLACNAIAGKPTVSNIRMATDETGKTTTTSYASSDSFFVFADLGGLKSGSVVEAKWYVITATGVQANSLINTSDYTYAAGISFVYFKLTTNDGSDWPSGSYRVELYLDGLKTGEQTFIVN
jgi:hypothetical protein